MRGVDDDVGIGPHALAVEGGHDESALPQMGVARKGEQGVGPGECFERRSRERVVGFGLRLQNLLNALAPGGHDNRSVESFHEHGVAVLFELVPVEGERVFDESQRGEETSSWSRHVHGHVRLSLLAV